MRDCSVRKGDSCMPGNVWLSIGLRGMFGLCIFVIRIILIEEDL